MQLVVKDVPVVCYCKESSWLRRVDHRLRVCRVIRKYIWSCCQFKLLDFGCSYCTSRHFNSLEFTKNLSLNRAEIIDAIIDKVTLLIIK